MVKGTTAAVRSDTVDVAVDGTAEHNTADDPTEYDDGSKAKSLPASSVSALKRHTINHVVELCCSDHSLLGKESAMRSMNHTRVTERKDFTSEIGFRYVLNRIERFRSPGSCVLLWVSMPCTGGSPWQIVNRRNGTNVTRERISAH